MVLAILFALFAKHHLKKGKGMATIAPMIVGIPIFRANCRQRFWYSLSRGINNTKLSNMQLTIFDTTEQQTSTQPPIVAIPCCVHGLVLGQVYKFNNQYFRCKRIRKSGINTFQLVDKNGNDVVKYDPRHGNVISDHGIRLISNKNML